MIIVIINCFQNIHQLLSIDYIDELIINIKINDFIILYGFKNKIKKITCNNNYIKSLRYLPKSVEELDIKGNIINLNYDKIKNITKLKIIY